MRVVVSAGGTGGHIYPALAIVSKIKEKEPTSEFLYIGTHNRMEKDIVPKYDIPFQSVKIYGLSRSISFRNIRNVGYCFTAYRQCLKMIKEFKPDIVIGVGGYVTVPVIMAAHKLGIPTFVHEQNSVVGMANKMLAKYATKIGVSFESTMDCFEKDKVSFTGNPCSEKALSIQPMDKKELGLSLHKKLVVLVMGSLGSEKVNDFLVSMLPMFNGKQYEVVYITGKDYYEEIKKKAKCGPNVKIVPYVEDATRLFKVADILVSRAGASIISELIALGVPTIYIPSPYVPNNHQLKNAMDLVEKKAALLIEEKDLKGDKLVREIDHLFDDRKLYQTIKTNLKEQMIPDSSTRIYEILKSLVSDR